MVVKSTQFASGNRENKLRQQNNSRVKPPPEALLSVMVRSSKKKRVSVGVRMQAPETGHPARPGPSVSERGGTKLRVVELRNTT